MRIHTFTRLTLFGALAALGLGLIAQSAAAADFYDGKRIRVIIGYSAGGGYDLYARTLARHMGRHIPGNPAFVPQNMTGAGSRKAANWLYNVAPKDGTVMATLGENTSLDQALKQKGVSFDVRKFQWIGNMIEDNSLTFSWAGLGLDTIEDVKKRGGLICGGTGATSPSIVSPVILNNLLGLNIKIISGYPGGSVVNLALERGEVNCRGSNTWSSMKATLGRWITANKVSPLVQWGLKAHPEVSAYAKRKVPLATDLGKTALDRKALTLVSSGLGRPIVVPPGVPAARVAMLRKAFQATMTDPKFLAETKKSKMDINPLSGETVQQLASETASASDEVVERTLKLLTASNIEEQTKYKSQPKKKKKK